MSIVSKLVIGESERELHNTDISYFRGTHATGKPSTETMGGMVSVSFTPRGDEDDILNWMFANRVNDDSVEYPRCLYVLKKVEIIFYEENYNGLELFKYKLEDCTCTYYSESFSNEFGMENIVVFSAAIQYYKNNDTFLLKSWQENWIPPIEDDPTIKENKTPIVIDFYLTNKKGEKIEKAEFEDYVYLNIKTKNLIGHTITVDLHNPRTDYKLNGKRLKNDILKNYQVNNDFEKIELEIVEQLEE